VSRLPRRLTLTGSMFSRRIVRISILVAVALWLQQPAAFGQPTDAIEKVTQLNREAVAAVDKREFEKARELLKRALDLCKTSGLEGHPAAARTHIHLGVVIIQGFKNHDLGMKQFAKALAIDPNITITKSLSTPPLEEAFAEAKALGGEAAAGGDDDATRPAPPTTGARAVAERRTEAPSASGFSYHTVSEVKQGSSIVVTVTVEDSLKFRKLILAYREQGTSEFLGREMEPVGDGAYRAEIPASATNGSSVAYYMEAQDDDGNAVGSRGTETRPLVISFAATAKPSSGGARAEATVEKKVENRRRHDEDEEEGGGKYFVGMLVGSGIGYTSGNGEVNADVPVSGTASGALLGHVAPELGYWYQPNLLLSLQGRFQIVTGTTELTKDGRSHDPVPAALAVFAKATWFAAASGLRPFVSGGLGGGQIRHVVTFANLTDCGPAGNQKCVDSVAAGPLLAQVGGGVFYKLGDSLALVFSTNAQLAAPNFTLNLDLNGGIGFAF
jgi:hypothetical protein